MKIKQILHQLLQDKDGNFSLREVLALLYVLLTIIAWIAQQFFGRNIPEFMFYSFISMIGAAAFGYSLERQSETNEGDRNCDKNCDRNSDKNPEKGKEEA